MNHGAPASPSYEWGSIAVAAAMIGVLSTHPRVQTSVNFLIREPELNPPIRLPTTFTINALTGRPYIHHDHGHGPAAGGAPLLGRTPEYQSEQ